MWRVRFIHQGKVRSALQRHPGKAPGILGPQPKSDRKCIKALRKSGKMIREIMADTGLIMASGCIAHSANSTMR